MHDTYFYTGPSNREHFTSTVPSSRPMPEGTQVYKLVGTYVKQPAVKKAKPFEVGKTYKRGDGTEVRILCIDRPGRASVISMGDNGDTFFNFVNGENTGGYRDWYLIPEYEQTPEQIIFVEGE